MEFSLKVRTEAARRANEHDYGYDPAFIASSALGRALCQAVLDGNLHLDPVELDKARIKHMVQHFLSWKLPENFRPDAGITFTPEFNVEYMAKQGKPPMRYEPTGTNLFDYTQAEAETEANARLIAAAPDLLAVAMEMIPRNLCTTNPNVPDELIVPLECTMGDLRRVAAAIAKATGAA